MSVKELFKKFVFGFITAGHTQTHDSEAELSRWIDKFVDTLNEEDCFDRNTMLDILDYVEEHMSNEASCNQTMSDKSFYRYNLNDFTHTCQLERYIKYVINLCRNINENYFYLNYF